MLTDKEEVLSIEEYSERFGIAKDTAQRQFRKATNSNGHTFEPMEGWKPRYENGQMLFVRKRGPFESIRDKWPKINAAFEEEIAKIMKHFDQFDSGYIKIAASRFLLGDWIQPDNLLTVLNILRDDVESSENELEITFAIGKGGSWRIKDCSNQQIAVAYQPTFLKAFFIAWQQQIQEKRDGIALSHDAPPWPLKIGNVSCEEIFDPKEENGASNPRGDWSVFQKYCLGCGSPPVKDDRYCTPSCKDSHRKWIERISKSDEDLCKLLLKRAEDRQLYTNVQKSRT